MCKGRISVLNQVSGVPSRGTEEWRYSSIILHPSTRWRRVISFMSRALYPRGELLPYPLYRRLCSRDTVEKRNNRTPADNRTPAVRPSITRHHSDLCRLHRKLIHSNSKLLPGYLWPINENPYKNWESPHTYICVGDPVFNRRFRRTYSLHLQCRWISEAHTVKEVSRK
jgi:hypothetical protein